MNQTAHPKSSPSDSLIRLFCAVELPEEVRALAGAHMAELRGRMPDVRAAWERPEKLHVTLKFLGEIARACATELSVAAAAAVRSVSPFDLRVEGAGTFPPRGLARVLWLGVQDAKGALAELQQHLEDECARAGFAREARPFHPHLTIARLRRPEGARRLAELHREKGFSSPAFSVNDLVIIRSELGPGGSRYTELARHALGGQ
jgi:RNA 2',3'-cyclic 3'-phosphodiesterase